MKQQVTSDIFLLLLKLICHQARGPILSGYIYSKEQSIGTFMKYCYRRSIMSFSTVMAQVKTHERSKYFSQTRSKLYVTRLHSSEIQNALVSFQTKQATELKTSEKLFTDINLPPLLPDEDKNFDGSLVSDFRK